VRILASGSQRSSCCVAELVGCHALRDGCQSPTEPLECAFLGVDPNGLAVWPVVIG